MMTKDSITIAGEEIKYRQYGDGIPMYLVHGFAGVHQDWDHVIPHLAKYYRVIVPDFIRVMVRYGMGRKPLSFTKHVDLFHEFVKGTTPNFPKRFVVGCSYGGALTWGSQIKHPEDFTASILIGAMPPNPKEHMDSGLLKTLLGLSTRPMLLEMYLRSPMALLALPLVENTFHAPWARPAKNRRLGFLTRRKLALFSEVIKSFGWLIKQEDWGAWEASLHRIENPNLILYGADDRVFIEGTNVKLSKLISGSTLKLVTGASHLPAKEKPEEVVELIQQYLRPFEY
ncbi:MAG: alpha/beta hydrolase [Oligoflexia bacterium]|nr:alpha/beta hydrolase [Oligoflexia bacterium]